MGYVGMPVEGATEKQYDTLMGLDRAIKKLSQDRDLAVADYLLRVQIFEFNLKYLWRHYGFKDDEKIIGKSFDRWTLGDTIQVIRDHKDKHFSTLISACEAINTTRGNVVHHILDDDTDYRSVVDEVIKQLPLIDKAQQEIWYYLEWDKKFR